jgi:hypothetical protein
VLTAQRINIVGPDGKLQMVISSRQDMPEGVVDGQTFHSQGRHQGAGMIFYNSLGDEDGGLTFGAAKTADGYAADAGLMFDQFKPDQTVGLTYTDDNSRRSSGLRVWQRPDRDLAEEIHALHAAQRLPAGPARAAVEKQALAGNALRLFAGRTPDAASAGRALSAYHAAHLALAEVLDAPLVTRDRAFARAPTHARVEVF